MKKLKSFCLTASFGLGLIGVAIPFQTFYSCKSNESKVNSITVEWDQSSPDEMNVGWTKKVRFNINTNGVFDDLENIQIIVNDENTQILKDLFGETNLFEKEGIEVQKIKNLPLDHLQIKFLKAYPKTKPLKIAFQYKKTKIVNQEKTFVVN